MKKVSVFLAIIMCFLMLTGCYRNSEENKVVETYENTEESILMTYYQMSDGTWRTDDYTYQYRLVITGRLNNAVKDTTFIILSNTKDVTFDQAWKTWLASGTKDLLAPKDAVIVGVY